MKKYFLLIAIILLPVIISCGSERAVAERRALMMPKTSEVPRNAKKYKEVVYKKRNKHQKKQLKKRSRYYKR